MVKRDPTNSIYLPIISSFTCATKHAGQIRATSGAKSRLIACWRLADLIAVGTARNMNVPVLQEILEAKPLDHFDDWERIIECGLDVPSGVLIVLGCTDAMDDALRIDVPKGRWVARVGYAGLEDLSEDGLKGNDRYRVQLWPGDVGQVTVLKH